MNEVALIVNCRVADNSQNGSKCTKRAPTSNLKNVISHERQTTYFKNILSEVELTGSLSDMGETV